jgi:succinate dehydrogenase / fumarate reductase flavoprotein subunit
MRSLTQGAAASWPIKQGYLSRTWNSSNFIPRALITEAARGEGAYLFNAKGERFMERYAPGHMELAPRDIVARAIQTEINEGRGFQAEYVHLDFQHLGKERILDLLPGIRQIAVDFAAVDPVAAPIPIQPAQHYSMGGIATNGDGETCLPGLFAAGECACVSVHGANRLGGNSLLDTLVFGKRAGAKAAEKARSEKVHLERSFLEERLNALESNLAKIFDRERKEPGFRLRDEMKASMTFQVGIFRSESELTSAREKIRALKGRSRNVGIKQHGLAFNNEIIQVLELEGMLAVAEVIIEGALARKESRGSHFRLDHPERDDTNWLRHTLAFITPDGPRLEYKNVTITSYPPKERTY